MSQIFINYFKIYVKRLRNKKKLKFNLKYLYVKIRFISKICFFSNSVITKFHEELHLGYNYTLR